MGLVEELLARFYAQRGNLGNGATLPGAGQFELERQLDRAARQAGGGVVDQVLASSKAQRAARPNPLKIR